MNIKLMIMGSQTNDKFTLCYTVDTFKLIPDEFPA